MHEAEGEVEVDEEEDDFPIVAAVLARRPQNWENEKVALRAMTKLIQHQLAVYRTSLSEDLDFLESRKGESEMDAAMNAARIMSFEKQTLMHWSRIAEKAVQHLDEAKGFAAVSGLDYDAALTSLMDSDVRFEDYFCGEKLQKHRLSKNEETRLLILIRREIIFKATGLPRRQRAQKHTHNKTGVSSAILIPPWSSPWSSRHEDFLGASTLFCDWIDFVS